MQLEVEADVLGRHSVQAICKHDLGSDYSITFTLLLRSSSAGEVPHGWRIEVQQAIVATHFDRSGSLPLPARVRPSSA